MATPASGLDILQSVQFVAAGDKRFALLGAGEWKALIEWLETVEDVTTVRRAYGQLAAAGSDRDAAGWLEWTSIENE